MKVIGHDGAELSTYVGQKYYITVLNSNPDIFVLQRPTDKIQSTLYINGVFNHSQQQYHVHILAELIEFMNE